jgi:bifunctional DNase/RNase
MADDTAVEMFVGGLLLDPHTQAPVVVLKNESGETHLPIWIGIAEATSIASAIKQLNMARPLTHDLMYDVFSEIGVKVERILITDLKDSTYYAELILSFGEKAITLDSRPSDAIAIALRAAAPIFVVPSVLERARVAFSAQMEQAEEAAREQSDAEKANQPEGDASEDDEASPDFKNVDKDKWDELLEQLDPDDFKYKM